MKDNRVIAAAKIGDIYVAVGDTVVIKTKRYVDHSEQQRIFENKGINLGSSFSARIIKLELPIVELDASLRYNSRHFCIDFNTIESIRVVEDEEVVDC